MTQQSTGRVRKSEKFTKEDYSAFVKWVDKQPTKIDAGLILGISRQGIDRLIAFKSGKPETLNKIREVINQKEELEQGNEQSTTK